MNFYCSSLLLIHVLSAAMIRVRVPHRGVILVNKPYFFDSVSRRNGPFSNGNLQGLLEAIMAGSGSTAELIFLRLVLLVCLKCNIPLNPYVTLNMQVRELTGDMNLTKSEIEATQVSDLSFSTSSLHLLHVLPSLPTPHLHGSQYQNAHLSDLNAAK